MSFESIQAQTLKSYFNNLPTSLELSDHDIDMLIGAGRDLLRNEPRFKDFLKANAGTRTPAAPPELSSAAVISH